MTDHVTLDTGQMRLTTSLVTQTHGPGEDSTRQAGPQKAHTWDESEPAEPAGGRLRGDKRACLWFTV